MSANFTLPTIPKNSILGLSYSGMHDSAVAIVSPQGETVFALSLERVSRVKQDGRFPSLILDQVPWDNIAKVALPVESHYESGRDITSAYHPLALSMADAVDRAHDDIFMQRLAHIDKELCFVPHHLSHAASAFWFSDFEESLCLVYDGGMANEEWFGGLYQASKTEGIRSIDTFGAQRYANVAHVYTAVTAVLGFTPLKHEGKITGLAAYGEPNALCDEVLNSWLVQPELLAGLVYWEHKYSTETPPLFKVNLSVVEQLKQSLKDVSREDLAFAVQHLAETHILEILTTWQQQGHSFKNICLSGGVFANVKINQRISALGFDGLFVSPPMADDGTALGAALHVASKNPEFTANRVKHVFFGPGGTQEEVDQLIAEKQITPLTLEADQTAAQVVAELLDQGEIIAVYQGASEFGPRALGNRSILANADNPEINITLNNCLNRTEFMPFAPMCLKEGAEQYFYNIDKVEHAAEFMTVTADCTDTMKNSCPAVVHCDGTARPQLVTAQGNPFIFDVLTHYKTLNGKPAIVNTSFNVHEEPIVCSPEDAFRGFFESGLDYLCIEGRIISLQQNRAAENVYLRRKMADFRRTLSSAKKTIAQQTELLRPTAAAHAEATAQAKQAQYEQQLSQLTTQRDQLTQQVAATTEQHHQLTQQVDALTTSASWQLTKPLRSLSSAVKSVLK